MERESTWANIGGCNRLLLIHARGSPVSLDPQEIRPEASSHGGGNRKTRQELKHREHSGLKKSHMIAKFALVALAVE